MRWKLIQLQDRYAYEALRAAQFHRYRDPFQICPSGLNQRPEPNPVPEPRPPNPFRPGRREAPSVPSRPDGAKRRPSRPVPYAPSGRPATLLLLNMFHAGVLGTNVLRAERI